ncbi:MAG TPA: phosphotransferase [Thermoplasmata archaeon]|nr:phosphotransferase [Thermoplasmata archaeon]
MMEAEGEFAAAALRFSVALAQRDFQAELRRLFRSHGWDRTLPAMRLRVLKAHKDRCTFEVSLDTDHGWQSLIGKVHDLDRSDLVGAMQSIVDAGFGPTAEFSIPTPLTYVPSLHVILEEHVPGTPAKEIFLNSSLDEQLATARRCGAWLARYHAGAPRQGRLAEPSELGVQIGYWAQQIRSSGGPLGIKAALLLRKLEAAMPAPGSFEARAGHGSYMPEHVLLSGRRTVTIDFDEYGVADPARDLAWFIVSLERLGLKSRGSVRAHDRSIRVFLEAYRDSGPQDATKHLAFYKAAECLHRAHRDLRKRFPPIPEWSDMMLDEGLSAL